MFGRVPRGVASWHWLYLAAKPSHVGVNVDGLACPLHRPMVYNHQTRRHDFLSNAALTHHVVVGNGAFPGEAKPSGSDI
jgi:hypothetical protein